MTKRFAVLGSPIAHSQSPVIHTAIYRELGLDWGYQRAEVAAGQLASYLTEAGSDFNGFSVTMPLKYEAAEIATKKSLLVATTGIANTLLLLESGEFAAWNTDIPGLSRALQKAAFDARETVILGAGATAVSAALAATELGINNLTVLARREAAAAESAAVISQHFKKLHLDINVSHGKLASEIVIADDPTLVISALPGTAAPDFPSALLAADLFDVAYDPRPTRLEKIFSEAGRQVETGLAMLLEQALLQVRIFVAGDISQPLPNEAELLSAARAALA
ncbi:shikimate dehydrogenase family protein [Canibacter zhoujuaniae]|uniref:shikimate dehydrogenase family protein n=1 Tax=Canibacter zhoujuaniae TaxID=2708343 RepID=UPI00141F5249|nr:shikimate dehydrogenase [Canibacter zhoujuaniae]